MSQTRSWNWLRIDRIPFASENVEQLMEPLHLIDNALMDDALTSGDRAIVLSADSFPHLFQGPIPIAVGSFGHKISPCGRARTRLPPDLYVAGDWSRPVCDLKYAACRGAAWKCSWLPDGRGSAGRPMFRDDASAAEWVQARN